MLSGKNKTDLKDMFILAIYTINKLQHRKCFVRIFIHSLQNFRNSLVRCAHSFVSKVLQRVNKNPYKALSMK